MTTTLSRRTMLAAGVAGAASFALGVPRSEAAGWSGYSQAIETGYLFAADLNTPQRLATLAQRLAERGHPASRIEKILGRNLLRVFAENFP